MSGSKTCYQVKMTIQGMQLEIWRRVLIPSGITFHKLHKIIQAAFGWQDYHLFLFGFPTCTISLPNPEMPVSKDEKDSRRVKIDTFFEENEQFIYEYDFGDSWIHLIEVESRVELEEEAFHPMCLDGARHRPPEDVGGVHGYEEFLEIISQPDHPDCDYMLQWAEKDTDGRKFEPDYFYKNEVNRKLQKIKC